MSVDSSTLFFFFVSDLSRDWKSTQSLSFTGARIKVIEYLRRFSIYHEEPRARFFLPVLPLKVLLFLKSSFFAGSFFFFLPVLGLKVLPLPVPTLPVLPLTVLSQPVLRSFFAGSSSNRSFPTGSAFVLCRFSVRSRFGRSGTALKGVRVRRLRFSVSTSFEEFKNNLATKWRSRFSNFPGSGPSLCPVHRGVREPLSRRK